MNISPLIRNSLVDLRSRGITLLGIAVISGSAIAQAQPPYRMVDSTFPAEDAFPTAWVDNDRVLFTGVELGRPAERPNQPYYYRGLKNAAFVWDVRRDKVTKFKDVILSTFCSTGTYISYRIGELQGGEQVSVVYAGEFGKEKKLGLASDYRYHNPVSCRYYRQPPPDWVQRRGEFSRRWIRPLLEQHGWLEMEKDMVPFLGYQDAPRLLRHLGDKGVQLPIDPVPSKTLNYAYTVSYLPFSDSYLISTNPIRMDELAAAWYLKPGGETQKISIPIGPWHTARYFGVAAGLFLISGSSRRFDHPGDAGGYLVVNGRVQRVLTGNPRQASISPNGCRVAFIYAWSQQAQADGYRAWKEGKPGNTIRMIDLCDGADK